MAGKEFQVIEEFQSRIERRREEARERQAARDTLSNETQIKVLDARLGVGVGAVKERARLTKEE